MLSLSLMEFANSKALFYNILAKVAWSLMSLDPHPRRFWSWFSDETASPKKPNQPRLVSGMRNGIARHTGMLLRCSKCAVRFVLVDCGKLQLIWWTPSAQAGKVSFSRL